MLTSLVVHRKPISVLALLMSICLFVTWSLGEVKQWIDIDWLDIIGEGGSTLAIGVWIIFILGSRPKGRVTDLLALGLGAMLLAFWQDALDEFIRIPADQWFDHWIESVPMPVGISILTYGLFHWYQEQIVVNDTLKKREQLYREHLWLDRITHVSRADLLKCQLEKMGKQQPKQPLGLIMIDVVRFSVFNREHGQAEGDRFLYQLAEFLQLNMRDQDLLTRYAADRFAIILPNSSPEETEELAQQLQDAVSHFYYRLQASGALYRHTILTGSAAQTGGDSQQLIAQANATLSQQKQITHVA